METPEPVTSHSTLRAIVTSRHLREPLIILLAYLPYFFVRGHAVSSAEEAFRNAGQLVDFETSVGIFEELSVQSALLSYDFAVHAFNLIYFYGHWPVIIAIGVFLFFKNPQVYYVTRNAFLISGLVAVILYAVYPVAPPRLSADGFADTLSMTVPVSMDQSRLVNPYAALPSMHVGWNLLIALGLFVGTGKLPLRVFAVLLPPSMLLATVVTGNHFFIDGIAGAALAIAAFALSFWLRKNGPMIRDALFAQARRLRPSGTA